MYLVKNVYRFSFDLENEYFNSEIQHEVPAVFNEIYN